MSAHMVDDKCITNVIHGLNRLKRDGYGITREFEKLGDATQIGRLLLEMNADAVNQRYNETTNGPEGTYRFPGSMPCSAIQSYKSTACLSYQCAEGSVPDTALYKLLERLEHAMAAFIIRRLPEYETAESG